MFRGGQNVWANSLISLTASRPLQAFLVSIFVLVIPLIATAAEVGGSPETVDVTAAFVAPSAAFTPLFITADAGLFTKYGLNVNARLINTTVAVKALLAEETDFLVDGPLLIAARLGGARVKYFGAYMQRFVFQIWGAKGISTLDQLKGKTVAVSPPRGAVDIATREALKKQGLVPDSDLKFVYNDQVPAILTAIVTGTAAAGTRSAPLTLNARNAGLNLLLDIRQLNIAGLQGDYRTTEKFLNNHPNTIYAFERAMAEGVILAKKDSAAAKNAIAKHLKVSDPKVLDAAYDFYAPYLETKFAVRNDVIRAELDYLNEKEFPQLKIANTSDFFDNSFVSNLTKAGLFSVDRYSSII